MKELLQVYETRAAESTEIWFIRSVPGMVNRIRSLVSSARNELRLMMGHFEKEVYGGAIAEISEFAMKRRVRAIVSEDVARAVSGSGLQGAEVLIGAAVAPFNIILSDSGGGALPPVVRAREPARSEKALHGLRLGQVHREGDQGLHRLPLLCAGRSRGGAGMETLSPPLAEDKAEEDGGYCRSEDSRGGARSQELQE